MEQLPNDMIRDVCKYLDSTHLWKLKMTNKNLMKEIRSHKPNKRCKHCGMLNSVRTSNSPNYCYQRDCMAGDFHPQYEKICSPFCGININN